MMRCELRRYFASGVGPGRVLRIRHRKDMKTLEESLDVPTTFSFFAAPNVLS
jgi:hypothetical protein